jgi:general secretion pathway protein H
MSATGTRAGEAGTTLLEALVVVAITAMVSGMVFPSLERALDQLSLREAAGKLTANLRLARAAAMRGDAHVAFVVAPDGRSYSWTGGPTVSMPGVLRITALKGQTIDFYRDGTTSGGVVVAQSPRRGVTVSVDPVSASVLRSAR